jgi:hypothetical protein
MAATNDWMQSALQHYREQREQIIEQLPKELLFEFRAAEVMIRKLEQDLGAGPQIIFSDPPYSSAAAQFPGSSSPSKSPVKSAEIRADEFFAMTINDAARAYLNRVGHAVSLEEMLDKLRAGGCKVGGANPKQTLYISLVRNTRDFVPTGSGFIGLRSFYPGLKAGAVKNADKQKKKSKHKSKAKSKASKLLAKKQPKPPHAPEESLAHKAVYGTLRDGEFHSKGAILKAGEDAGVKAIAIRGILSNAKDLEVKGDSYRLKQTN